MSNSAGNPATSAAAKADEMNARHDNAANAPQESAEELAYANRPFRGWRLLGVIGTVVLVLAIVSAIVDWLVIGPLEGRVF